MGNPDGFAILKKVKVLNPSSKNIVITGNQDLASAIKAIKLGVDDYLLKPFSLSELLESVRKSIDELTHNRKATAGAILSEEQIHAMIL